jgi:hypothetical protein
MFSKNLALGLLLLTSACGASTITASSRSERGAGGGPAYGPIVGEARTPPNVEPPMFDRPIDDRGAGVRDNPRFRIESDCWRCR